MSRRSAIGIAASILLLAGSAFGGSPSIFDFYQRPGGAKASQSLKAASLAASAASPITCEAVPLGGGGSGCTIKLDLEQYKAAGDCVAELPDVYVAITDGQSMDRTITWEIVNRTGNTVYYFDPTVEPAIALFSPKPKALARNWDQGKPVAPSAASAPYVTSYTWTLLEDAKLTSVIGKLIRFYPFILKRDPNDPHKDPVPCTIKDPVIGNGSN